MGKTIGNLARLTKASHKPAESMYGNADVKSAAGKPSQRAGGETEDVIDAEFDVGR